MKPKDVAEALMFALGLVALIVLAGYLEAAPLGVSVWIGVILGFFLWGVWLYLVIRDRKRERAEAAIDPLLWVSDGKQWVAMDGSGRTKPFKRPLTRAAARGQQLFDQEEVV